MQIGYLNWWNIFRFIFRRLKMTFFHKIVVAEENNFSSNAQHNFAKCKAISKCKNDKLWKYLQLLFLIFLISPSRGGNQNLLPHPFPPTYLKDGGELSMLAMSRGEDSAVIALLMSKCLCLWSGWKWQWGVNEIASFFICCPVNRDCLWKKS